MKAVALLSGGLDSSLALAVAKLEKGYEQIFPLTFDYGQKTAEREIKAAKEIAKWLGVEENHKILQLTYLRDILQARLLNSEKKLLKEDGILEYVPMRNTMFLSIGAAWAETLDVDAIIIGSNVSDAVCPDNSVEFINAFQSVIEKGSVAKRIKIYAPLLEGNLNKNLIIKKSVDLQLPLEHTWSCHNNIDKPCGVCGNCVNRIIAFKNNSIADPLEYEVIAG